MPLIEWRDEFRIGVPAVDHEHQELIGLINALFEETTRQGAAAPLGDLFGEIYNGISAHFALEERLMREQRYFEYEAHKTDHERLLDEIREIMDGYELGAYRDLEGTLAARLEEWFTHHFKTFDARLHTFLD